MDTGFGRRLRAYGSPLIVTQLIMLHDHNDCRGHRRGVCFPVCVRTLESWSLRESVVGPLGWRITLLPRPWLGAC